MTITDPKVLWQRIDARRRQAEMLLSLAGHETVKEQFRLGLRDLDEALGWLDRKPNSKSCSLPPGTRGLAVEARRADTAH